jgi:phosphoribosylformimino-5-aminoimidazole carboxamide ribotide isomerase
MHFRIVPVIDLKGGRAVHAVGGQRDQYQPLRSVWQASPRPIPLAIALREGLGLGSLYLADLDAIAGGPPSLALYPGLAELGLDLWIDAGFVDARSADQLLDLNRPNLSAVVGLESVSGPGGLAGIIERVGADRTIFSLDLFEGRPRSCPGADWMTDDPIEIAGRAIAEGANRLIILELTRVGTGRGLGTDRLLAGIHEAHPEVSITVGGGISGIPEIASLREAGASAVLVGSAIHDGRIGRRELERLDRQAGGG